MCSGPVDCVPRQQPYLRLELRYLYGEFAGNSGRTQYEDVFAWRQLCAEGERKPGGDTGVGQGSGGFSAATRELFALQRIPEFLGLVTFRERLQRRQVQTGFPLSSRSTSVSLPFTTSRARTRSAVSCLTFDPVRAISSPFAKLTPMSSRKDFGHR